MGGTKKLLWIGRMEHGLHAITVQSRGKCALTLHSCISVTDRVKIDELNTSIATGPLYVHTEFERSYLRICGFEPHWISDLVASARNWLQGSKICFPVV